LINALEALNSFHNAIRLIYSPDLNLLPNVDITSITLANLLVRPLNPCSNNIIMAILTLLKVLSYL